MNPNECKHSDWPVCIGGSAVIRRSCGGCGYALAEADESLPPVADSSLPQGLSFIGIFHALDGGFIGVRPMHGDDMRSLQKMAVDSFDRGMGVIVTVRLASFEELAEKRATTAQTLIAGVEEVEP